MTLKLHLVTSFESIVLTLLLLAIGVSQTFAQGDFRKGYYITNENDSISGLIDYRAAKSSNESCVYRESNSNQTVNYSPEQILAYGFIDGKRFVSKELPKSLGSKQIFMEQLVDGSASLYRYGNNFYIQLDSLIFLPPKETREFVVGGSTMLKTVKPYVGMLNYLLADCSLSANFTDYAEKDLANLIQDYNRCKGAPGNVYKNSLKWIKLNFQGFSGIDVANLTIERLPKNTFDKSVSPILGLSLDLSSPRIFDRFFCSLDVIYTKKYYQGFLVSDPELSYTEYFDYYINVELLKIPISVRYNFLSEAQTPYVKVGLSQYLELSSSLRRLKEAEAGGTVITSYDEIQFGLRNQNGFWIGIGYSKVVYKDLKGFIELRFEVSNGFNGDGIPLTIKSNNSIGLLVGIRL